MFKIKDKNIAYVLAVVFLLILLSVLIPTIRKPALDVLKYPLKLLTLLKRELGGIIFYHHNLVQNERFKKEIDLLRQRLNAADEFYLENARLKNLLRFKQETPYKAIASRVIGRSLDSWSSAVIIDKGRYHGIRHGMAVISYLGLVGRIVEASEYTSKVMLINDPNIGVSAMVKRSRQEGLVSGTLGSSLVMRYLPKDCDIQISDLIITSGMTVTYPKGLLIGKVVDVGDEFSGLSRYAVVKPTVDLTNIEEVLVIVQLAQ